MQKNHYYIASSVSELKLPRNLDLDDVVVYSSPFLEFPFMVKTCRSLSIFLLLYFVWAVKNSCVYEKENFIVKFSQYSVNVNTMTTYFFPLSTGQAQIIL